MKSAIPTVGLVDAMPDQPTHFEREVTKMGGSDQGLRYPAA